MAGRSTFCPLASKVLTSQASLGDLPPITRTTVKLVMPVGHAKKVVRKGQSVCTSPPPNPTEPKALLPDP
jgi:hypothetical protein